MIRPSTIILPTLKCFAVDDEMAALNRIEEFVRTTQGLSFAGKSTDPVKTLEDFESGQRPLPDIIFLDLEMKGISGQEFAAAVMNKVMIVFATAHQYFAAESYRLNAIDYLLKPFSYDIFEQAINKCKKIKMSGLPLGTEQQKLYLIKDTMTGQAITVNLDDISFLESVGNYTLMHYYDGSKIMPHSSLTKLISDLNYEYLQQIHKSHAVNLRHVTAFDSGKTVVVANDKTLGVGRTFRKVVKERLRNRPK